MDSAANDFIRRIRGCSPEDEEDSTIKSASVRMNAGLLARIESLAELANMSRNTAMVELLSLGQEMIWNELTDEEKKRVEESTIKKLQDWFSPAKKADKMR